MDKMKKLLALVMVVCVVCCLPVYASADSTIDHSKTGSLTLYKYDLTSAKADGAWSEGSYIATGESDQGIIEAMAGYAVPGVEFSYIKVADVNIDYAWEDVSTLYTFSSRLRSK